ncbi:hypothetical protein MMARJ_09480 [Mycobacterium marseillense]|uniref:Uncharacterized protein n=1 Tax=Mycobacterium marseillense TaxID=701042 RepID=A0ABM7J8M1_9MYCO|nr:hypothetical protein MMARJ_09480 [Mycobacterium marseillense]
MTINRQFDNVDAHGALIRAQAVFLDPEHRGLLPSTLGRLEFGGDSW